MSKISDRQLSHGDFLTILQSRPCKEKYALKRNHKDNHIHWHIQSNAFISGTRSLYRGCSYESEWKWGSEIDFSCTGQGIGNGWGPGDLFWKSFYTVVFYTIYRQSQMLVWEHYYWDQYDWYDCVCVCECCITFILLGNKLLNLLVPKWHGRRVYNVQPHKHFTMVTISYCNHCD